MAQAATMGPPLSPREPRRSGRRSAPFSSAASRSPDSEPLPRQKDIPLRPALVSTNNNSRNKRPKQEDQDESVDDRKNAHAHSGSSTNGTSNGRSKRKTKERDKQIAIPDNVPDTSTPHAEDGAADAAEDEEQGITRCVCGSTGAPLNVFSSPSISLYIRQGEDDPDAGEFMVQCETCKVWQHGLCMGYQSEDQVHDDDYYCELCRPELHTELLKCVHFILLLFRVIETERQKISETASSFIHKFPCARFACFSITFSSSCQTAIKKTKYHEQQRCRL